MLPPTRRIIRVICILSLSLYMLNYGIRAMGRYYSHEHSSNDKRYPVYIMNVYLITDDMIRMTLITKCEYSPTLRVYIGEQYSTSASYEWLDNCPPHWRPKCQYGGRYANAVFPKEAIKEVLLGKSPLLIGHAAGQSIRKRIRLIDSRVDSSGPRPHRLAICVSPIMQLAAWVLLPRFFEMWISHGATKFYAIVQSMTPEFDAMLRIYENDPKIDIERVPWGMLPTAADFFSEDNPNNQITGAEQTLSLNDCVLRARGSAEYVATVDYDEVFVVRSNTTLLELLDSFNSNDSDASAFVFRSSYGFFDDQTRFLRHPANLTFDSLSNILLENRIYEGGLMSKLIVRPERTKSVNIHMTREMEDKKFKTLVVDPNIAQIFHLRLVENVAATRENSSPNNELNKYIPQWTKRYNERINVETKRIEKEQIKGNRITIIDEEWPNRSHKVAQEMEGCFLKYYFAAQNCSAHTKCFPNITSVREDEWIHSEKTMVIL